MGGGCWVTSGALDQLWWERVHRLAGFLEHFGEPAICDSFWDAFLGHAGLRIPSVICLLEGQTTCKTDGFACRMGGELMSSSSFPAPGVCGSLKLYCTISPFQWFMTPGRELGIHCSCRHLTGEHTYPSPAIPTNSALRVS